jgi:chromosome segregation ATPase
MLQVTYVKQQLQTLQQHMSEKMSVIRKLEMELEKQQKEVNQMQRSYRSVASEREAMESRLAEKNIQVLQQEGTISTLTKQLEDIMEVRDSMLEEVAQFHDQLQNAKYKEFETEGKLKNSSLIINELEEKILWMSNDSRKAKTELTDLKHQNTALQKLILQKNEETKELKHALNDLKKKVQELEEEVLVKEGQIAIISSQNRESYESF